MIAFAKKTFSDESTSNPEDKFLAILPQIKEQARVAFRAAKHEQRDELIAEVVANAFCAYARLVERGKGDVAFATPLAMFAIRQVRAGRRVGNKMNVRDITSSYCQIFKGINVERLDQWCDEDSEWKEVVVEDRYTGPAETAAARIDVAAWLRSLGKKKGRIAKALANGERTRNVAQMFGISEGRVSQMRNEFQESWNEFQGELAAA
jgi:hypothetical protein